VSHSTPEVPPTARSTPRERQAAAAEPARSPVRRALATLLRQERFAPPLTLERMEALAAGVESDSGIGALSPAEHSWLMELRAATLHEWAAAPPASRPGVAALLAAFDRALAAPRTDPVAPVVELAHDLRSPLTSILFLAGALRAPQPEPLTDIHRRQVGIIYSAALSVSSMTSDIVDYFQTTHTAAHTEAAPFSVRGVMDSVRDMMLPMVDESNVELRMTYPPEGLRVGSSVALGRVLLNLASNGLRLTRRGYVEITASEPEPGRLRFQVRDTGPGIGPELRETLFEPFSPRRDRPGMAFSGTGLGLGICRKILNAAGSELEVESAPGEGTTFSFTLELPRAEQP
jgi:signal transduction histidine kinase